MFSLGHIVYMLILIPLSVVMGVFLAKMNSNTKKIVLVCGILGVASELFRSAWWVSYVESYRQPDGPGYHFLNPTYLPLHLCSIQIFIMMFMGLTKNEKTRKKLIAFFIPTALWGAAFALLIPTALSNHGAMHPITINYFIFHAMLVFLAIYLYIKEFNNLTVKSYCQCMVMVTVLFIGSIYLNALLQDHQTNYFFTSQPPMENLPLLNVNNGWLMYIFNLMLIGSILMTLTYLPIFIKGKNEKNNQ